MNKILTIFCMLLMILSFSACKDSDDDDDAVATTTTSSSSSSTTTNCAGDITSDTITISINDGSVDVYTKDVSDDNPTWSDPRLFWEKQTNGNYHFVTSSNYSLDSSQDGTADYSGDFGGLDAWNLFASLELSSDVVAAGIYDDKIEMFAYSPDGTDDVYLFDTSITDSTGDVTIDTWADTVGDYVKGCYQFTACFINDGTSSSPNPCDDGSVDIAGAFKILRGTDE